MAKAIVRPSCAAQNANGFLPAAGKRRHTLKTATPKRAPGTTKVTEPRSAIAQSACSPSERKLTVLATNNGIQPKQ